MNHGYRQNFHQYGSNGYQQQFNGMYQQRQPFPPPWNANMSGQFSSGGFPPHNFHPRGQFPGGPNCGQRPHHSQNNQRGHFNNRPQQNNNKQFHHNNGKNNKKKIDKRDLPENNKYFCDTCDRGYANQEKFQEHVDSHEKCSDPTCSYIAASKLVRMHYQMQHRTGFAKKIWQLDSPEDVKRWIEERKRNFPTAENIEKKKSTASAKNARGEKLDNKYFGKMRGGDNQNKRGRNRNRKRQHHDCSFTNEDESSTKKSCTETSNSVSEDTPQDETDPLSAILQQPHSETEERKESETGDLIAAGGLASIMSSYAADSDSEESPQSTPIIDKATHSQPSVTHKKEEQVRQAPKHLTNKQKRNQKKKLVTEVFNTKRPTLLERLLANEIRHERNVLLQCVHYIVKKNFFGVEVDGKRNNAGS